MIPHSDDPDVRCVLSDIDAGDLASLPILADALEDAGADARGVLKLRIFLRTRYRPERTTRPTDWREWWEWQNAEVALPANWVLPNRVFNNLRMSRYRSGYQANYHSAAIAVWDAATCTYF